MSGVPSFCVLFVWMCFCECSGITNYENHEKNLIGEEDRRGVTVKEDARVNDLKKSQPTKRGLWLISQHQQSSDYDATSGGYHGSSGPGGYGYVDSGAYGVTGGGYGYGGVGGGGGGTGGGYHKEPIFGFGQGHGYGHGHGHGYSGGGSNFGYAGANYDHSGYGDSGHEQGLSHGNDGYSKLALKKFLIPLAGLALLGAAAALSSNPVLLQLGSIHSGRRKRSAASESSSSGSVYPANPWTKPEFSN